MPFFDYECEQCGNVVTDVLVPRYDKTVRCAMRTCVNKAGEGPPMKRRPCAPPRYRDHTTDGVPTNVPDSFRPIQVGHGGSSRVSAKQKAKHKPKETV